MALKALVNVVLAALKVLVLSKVKALDAAGPADGKNIATPALVKYNVPLPYCGIANGPALDTVAVPAVTVQTPAPMFCKTKVSPALNRDVLTVIVVALALFITTRVPLSVATSV